MSWNHGKRCFHCAYDISACRPGDPCPECGASRNRLSFQGWTVCAVRVAAPVLVIMALSLAASLLKRDVAMLGGMLGVTVVGFACIAGFVMLIMFVSGWPTWPDWRRSVVLPGWLAAIVFLCFVAYEIAVPPAVDPMYPISGFVAGAIFGTLIGIAAAGVGAVLSRRARR